MLLCLLVLLVFSVLLVICGLQTLFYFKIWLHVNKLSQRIENSVANWYIYILDFTNLVYFSDRLVSEIMVWYMSLNLVYFYAFW